MPALPTSVTARIANALAGLTATSGDDPLPALRALLDSLRPPRRHIDEEGPQRWAFLLEILREHDELRCALRDTILQLFVRHRQLSFYTDSGLLPNTGFFSELNRLLMHKCLPEVHDNSELRSVIAALFSHRHDGEWLASIPLEDRRALWLLLDLQGSDDPEALRSMVDAMLEAMLVLSHRIAAMGLSPDLMRVYPRLSEVESPFISMNIELVEFVASFRRGLAGEQETDDGSHLFVLISQCQDTVNRARAASARAGTSMTLSYLLTRLGQHLDRLTLLARVMTVRVRPDSPDELTGYWTDFLFDALDGERQHNSIRRHFANLTNMLALRITDNAARTGEHYIANTRAEWFLMLRQAAGAGVLIALLALLKIAGSGLQLPPASQAWLNGIIYSGGFAVIYMLHFVIATKQPAMTAATIAGHISQTRGRLRETERIVDLMANTFRSQLAAIAGNILVAFPLAILLLLALQLHSANGWVSADKAQYLLDDVMPFTSPALLYAAVAGVWLFLTGLVSGYLDNRAAYTQLGPRIAQLRWLRAVLRPRGAEAAGRYIAEHAGGLGGNIFFGLMLGLTPLFGSALGLPLDIRHIAFSSANVGYALVALDFAVPLRTVIEAVAGVLLIGAVNLTVSFSLALWVAMRSRKVDFWLLAPVLPRLWQRLRQQPQQFFLPPPALAAPDQHQG